MNNKVDSGLLDEGKPKKDESIWVVQVTQPPLLDGWIMSRAEETKELADLWKGVFEDKEKLRRTPKQPDCHYRVVRYVPADEAERLRELLRRCEWPGHQCPVCGWFDKNGHAPDCELAKALGNSAAIEKVLTKEAK